MAQNQLYNWKLDLNRVKTHKSHNSGPLYTACRQLYESQELLSADWLVRLHPISSSLLWISPKVWRICHMSPLPNMWCSASFLNFRGLLFLLIGTLFQYRISSFSGEMLGFLYLILHEDTVSGHRNRSSYSEYSSTLIFQGDLWCFSEAEPVVYINLNRLMQNTREGWL